MSKLISSSDERELRREQITLLVKSYYSKLDFLKYESLDVLINKASDLFLDSDLTIDEINEKLIEAIAERKRAITERYDDNKVRDNHEKIYGRLEQIVRELNSENVDYQLTGALCGYMKYDEESDRCHDDIDFNINEADLEKFRKICLKLGLYFEDNRLSSPRILKDGIPSDEHEVIAKDPNSDFHIGVFPYERKKDGSVVAKDYYHDDNGNPCVREEIYSSELADVIFGGEEIDFRGTPIRITPPEFIYLLKNYNKNEKDMHDVQFLENRVDLNIVTNINMLSKIGKRIEYSPVEELSVLNNTEDELGLMLADDEEKSEEFNSSRKKEGIKMLVKEKQQVEQQEQQVSVNEEGFISNAIITTLAIITFVLCFIGVAVIYLVQM